MALGPAEGARPSRDQKGAPALTGPPRIPGPHGLESDRRRGPHARLSTATHVS